MEIVVIFGVLLLLFRAIDGGGGGGGGGKIDITEWSEKDRQKLAKGLKAARKKNPERYARAMEHIEGFD